MGLDQYAFARKEGQAEVKLMQWRKHANLEGWMANLYHSRGGAGDFNCVDLKLREEDLDRLQEECQNLETARGFFWGESHPDDDVDTQEFISLAYKRLNDGWTIIYTSWW